MSVVTAVTASGNSIRVSEDGIKPSASQRWKIYSESKRSPLDTSICAGSKRTGSTTSVRRAQPPCPATSQLRIPRNGWPPARAQLAPSAPDAFRLCRYSGLNAHPGSSLVRAKLVSDRARRESLVRQFNRLRQFPREPIACPMDDGSQILALLGYVNGRRVGIAVALTGCEGVTNGDLTRTAAAFGGPPELGQRLLALLKRLTQ